MISLQEITTRRTGLALSALTGAVLIIGYAGVQWLEGNWQPTALEMQPSTRQENTSAPEQPQPLVLHPRAPDGAVPAGWELPINESPIDTAARGREMR